MSIKVGGLLKKYTEYIYISLHQCINVAELRNKIYKYEYMNKISLFIQGIIEEDYSDDISMEAATVHILENSRQKAKSDDAASRKSHIINDIPEAPSRRRAKRSAMPDMSNVGVPSIEPSAFESNFRDHFETLFPGEKNQLDEHQWSHQDADMKFEFVIEGNLRILNLLFAHIF